MKLNSIGILQRLRQLLMALLSPYGFSNGSGEVSLPLFAQMIHTYSPCRLIDNLSLYKMY